MKYMRKYLDEQHWEEISRMELIERLGRCYRNVRQIVEELEDGKLEQIKTLFAVYKVEEVRDESDQD